MQISISLAKQTALSNTNYSQQKWLSHTTHNSSNVVRFFRSGQIDALWRVMHGNIYQSTMHIFLRFWQGTTTKAPTTTTTQLMPPLQTKLRHKRRSPIPMHQCSHLSKQTKTKMHNKWRDMWHNEMQTIIPYIHHWLQNWERSQWPISEASENQKYAHLMPISISKRRPL